MITLPDTKYGTKRKVIISGFAQWDHWNTISQVLFYVQMIDSNGNLLSDKSINQDRAVVYPLTNTNRVDSAFNTVQSGGTGEYDYFFNMVINPEGKTIVDILLLLGNKLKTRGIFE